jgi:hypothetical protein
VEVQKTTFEYNIYFAKHIYYYCNAVKNSEKNCRKMKEVLYYMEHNVIKRYRPFASIEQLEPNLKKININDIKKGEY